MDSKLVEVIGRNYLVVELLSAGLEVATPARDRGIDLLVYEDQNGSGRFNARPVQLKAAWKQSFGIQKKYDKFPELMLIHIWGLHEIGSAESFAMTQEDAVHIGELMGWTRTKSWTEKGAYIQTSPSKKLRSLLEPYLVLRDCWREVLFGASG